MKVTLHLEGTREEITDQLQEFKTILETSSKNQPPAGKRGRKPKDEEEEVEEPEVDAKEEVEEPEEESEEEEEVEEEEAADDSDEEPTTKAVTKAFRAFAAQGKAQNKRSIEILKGYMVDHVDKLNVKQRKEALKKLKKVDHVDKLNVKQRKVAFGGSSKGQKKGDRLDY